MSSPVLLLFGAGRNTGLATAKKFASGGYKVAAVSRHPSAQLKETAHLILPGDLSEPGQIEGIFEKVTKELGVPHVVVYNAYDSHFVPVDNPLSAPIAAFAHNLNVNTVSAYAAAQQAVKGFATLPDSASRTYLFTGNMQNTQLHPATFTLGVGKNATAYFVEVGAAMYKSKYKFYYVDERDAQGESVLAGIDGDAHADTFWELSQKKEQGPWDYTFVKGQGYVRTKDAPADREVREFKLEGLPEGGISFDEFLRRSAEAAGK